MSSDQARARVESQMPQEERVTHADVVIANDGGEAELKSAVKDHWDQRVASKVQGDR